MQADEVGGSNQLIERNHLDTHRLCDLGIEIRIVGLNIELHPLGARRHLFAHVTQADNAHGASGYTIDPATITVQFRRVPPPFTIAHVLIHAHELARNRDQQANRLFGNFDGVAAGSVTDSYAELLGGREIHPVDADSSAADDLSLLQLRDDFFGEGDRAVHDDPVRVAAHFNDLCIVGGTRDHELGVDLIKDGFDEIDRNVIAAEVFNAKFSHCFLRPQSKGLGRIVPKNLAARFDGDLIVAADRAYRLVRELVDGVAVRVVGSDHQVIVSDVLDENGGQLFSSLTTHPTIAFEIIAGLFFGDFGGAVRLMFPMFVHALQPERHPATAGFKMGDFQLGELLQHAVRAEVETSEHLFQWMASDMTAEFTVAIRASLRQHRASAFMDANCYA